MSAAESKYYREICALTMGQLECIVASEPAPTTVWLAVAHVTDWLVKRAEGQRSYQVQKEIALVKRRGPVEKGAVTKGIREEQISCVLVED